MRADFSYFQFPAWVEICRLKNGVSVLDDPRWAELQHAYGSAADTPAFATLESAKSMGLKNVGLLGTKFTMQSNFFGNRFAKEGISVVVPIIEEQEFIHDKLVKEIELGIFSNETRNGLLSVIDSMVKRSNIEAVILGCTELPLILTQSDYKLPLLNTTEIHVSAICNCFLQPSNE